LKRPCRSERGFVPALEVAPVCGRLVAGPLWRVAHGPAYGLQEGRAVLDRRDRNALTGAEFPVPALANPRVVRLTLPLLSTAEVRGEHRRMLRVLGAAAEALWVPDVSLVQAELNARAVWGAVAVPGEGAATTRDSPEGLVPQLPDRRTGVTVQGVRDTSRDVAGSGGAPPGLPPALGCG
jgi:hypothetical protein